MKALVIESIRSLRARLHNLLREVLADGRSDPRMGVAVALAMLLPGSFVVLPLIWLWHRRNGSGLRPAPVATRDER